MNLMKKVVWTVLAMAWLITQAAGNLIISFADVMRAALGEDGEPASIITFLVCLAASVVMFGFTGILAAVFRIN